MTTAGFDRTEEFRDRSGEVVAGRYRLDALLGRGGMGHVYRAQHVELDEPVVLKFIDPAFAQDPVARTRFRREAKALIRLRHPGIVTMREFGEHEGILFLVMELLEGQTLGARLADPSNSLSLEAKFEIFLQLGAVLETIHAAGVVHRDVKPDNVMLVPNRTPSTAGTERAVLMDFGVARVQATSEVGVSTTGLVMGTPSFMSPEQCAGQPAVPESDLYALGVMFFLTMSGRLPFTSETAALAMTHHLFVAPPKLTTTATGQAINSGLSRLVEDLLAKKPESRPSATQFLERLNAARSGSDPITVGSARVEQRLVDEAKSRHERAIAQTNLGHEPESGLSLEATLRPGYPQVAQPKVWLRGFPPQRRSYLVASLAVNGIAVVEDDGTASPANANELAIAILFGAGAAPSADSVRDLRRSPATTSLPILVIDVREASEITDLIRAGASDAALTDLGDDAIVAKAWRLIRRRR